MNAAAPDDPRLRDLIVGLGALLGCPAGSVWVFDAASQSMACRDVAVAPGFDGAGLHHHVRLAGGDSLPGRAWAAATPVSGPLGAELGVRPEAGLSGALAFAVRGVRDPIAVIALYARETPELGPDLRASLSSLGRVLGSFIEHRRDLAGTSVLSPREVDVLQLAADGRTGPGIADELALSQLTVKSHFAHIYRKLGTTDRANAVAQAMRRGLIR